MTSAQVQGKHSSELDHHFKSVETPPFSKARLNSIINWDDHRDKALVMENPEVIALSFNRMNKT